ncbi:GDSL-type esterase/lipase family protein [Chitinophaga niabensis]|uniref:Lysophospholipase L1 n=1 Tax=Chitinophaga niabensis TaxID=536979 RepID=A0A1N6K2K3_9BACT|nr:GDSL-type esterase/lipase family protein [Chitinophaga niabensis]SIO50741.1 Lysophospholipase L1 [Chitinophaga niabensis]
MNISRSSCRILVCILITCSASAQQKFLYNDTCLYPFFAYLQDKGTAKVFHLGDSHVQAGFLPNAVAAGLKKKFGDAGTGWVFPYNLAGTNGPDNYRWSSNIRWSADRIVDRNISAWPGPGGIAIAGNNPVLTYTGQNITEVKAFFKEGTAEINDGELTQEDAGFGKAALIRFHGPQTTFSLRWPSQTVRFYGAIVYSGDPGILYNSIGINGAQFMHYNQDAATIPTQMAILEPQLVIISLGTNEAFGGVSATQLRQEMDKTVTAIRENAPEATILFTTPPSGMMKKRQVPYKKKGKTRYRISYVSNSQVAVIRAEMIRFCKDNDIAWWDFHEVMKADKNFARGWSQDHVHFNAFGYTRQGNLLYDAIIASWEKWQQK